MGKSILLVLFSFAGSLHQHAATATWPCREEVTMFKFNPWMQPPLPNRKRSPAARRLCGFTLLRPINFFCHQGVRLACGRDGDGLFERAGVPLCSLSFSSPERHHTYSDGDATKWDTDQKCVDHSLSYCPHSLPQASQICFQFFP